MIKGISEYLEKNYKDPNICLYSVASKFLITESYLSFFYKEQTGVNFSYKLEKIRVEHAVDLLKDTKMHIKEIASEVGYFSDKTFRRVFRRVKGLSPSEFRQEYILNRII